MKKYLTILILFFPISFLKAQENQESIPNDTAQTVALVAYWSKGDVRKYEVKNIELEYKNEKLTKADSSINEAIFSVIDSSATHYTVSWKSSYDLRMFSGLRSIFPKTDKKFYYDLKVKTDEMGTIISYENIKEITKEFSKELDLWFNEFQQSLNGDKFKLKEVETHIKPLVESVKSDAVLTSVLFQDFNLGLSFFGKEYSLIDTVRAKDFLPNPFDANIPLEADVVFFTESYDPANDYISFVNETTFTDEATEKLKNLMFSKVNINKEKFNLEDYKFSNYIYVEYYYNPGIPIFIFHEKNTNYSDKDKTILKTLTRSMRWVE